MQEFFIEIKKMLAGIGVLLLLMISISAFSGHTELILGFTFGTFASAVYYLFICYRVRKSAGLPAAKAIAYMRTGWLVRLFFVVIVLILSLKIPYIHFGAAVAGLFSLQIVLFVKAVVLIGKNLLS
jgi:hypothetical protein